MSTIRTGRLQPLATPERRFHPERMTPEAFYPLAYRLMHLCRRFEQRLMELFQKGYVKGTVTMGMGNEATALGMSLPLRPGRDVVSFLHRDLIGHLLFGAELRQLVCQYAANAQSPTHAREGNVHHGDAARRRFPMISHLGNMSSPVGGAVWTARRRGEDVVGLSVVGDGGSSTGEFHESLNFASVFGVPVLYVVQNNGYSFSTPTSMQYRCRRISDRAAGYGICGRTIDGTDAWLVYTAVCDALDWMREHSLPYILECQCVRLHGHAAYDKGEYMTKEEMDRYFLRDPLPATRQKLLELELASPADLAGWEEEIDEEIRAAVASALDVPRPDAAAQAWTPFAPATRQKAKPYAASKVKNGDAVKRALDYILSEHPEAYLLGLDIGQYGSAFKTCKGLIDKHGPQRVIDTPLSESATIGYAIGSSQVGGRPIIEFQFADFGTEAATQLGLNAGTWHYRSGAAVPILVRLPCGGGLTLGAFHSGEFEGLWSRFCGLKILYPATPQETFEALLAGFYDPNPCLVLENKSIYWSKPGDIAFDGDVAAAWRPRRYREGSDITVVAIGAMVYEALAAAEKCGASVEVWNPFILQPLDLGPIVESVRRTGRLLVVQEAGQTQGLGDRILSVIVKDTFGGLRCAPRVVAAPDVPVPFAPELEARYRPCAAQLQASIVEMLGEG